MGIVKSFPRCSMTPFGNFRRLMQKFPGSKVTSLSNSHSQKVYIDSQAQKKGIKNLKVVTGDVKDYEFPENRFFLSKY